MSHTSAHGPDARTNRLVTRARQAEAGRARLPEFVPAICPRRGAVLGLVVAEGEVLCRDCGVWAPATDPAGATPRGRPDGATHEIQPGA
jgi:hypothetical protein